MNTKEKGKRGEDKAVKYLLNKGYNIITRNYQARRGEIDCIAEDPDDGIVFLEVKTGTGHSFGHPFYRITRGKQKKIVNMARQYLAEHSITQRACRFDVISIVEDKIEHLKNAFLA